MTKKVLIALLAVSLSIVSLAGAQQVKKSARIGYLALGSGLGEPEAGLKQQLRDLGWVEGQNLSIDYRWAGNDIGRLSGLARELIDLKVDVLAVSATPVIHAAKSATTTIPIVMIGAADPIASGFVASLARPGGNITGLSLQSPELAGKRLELLKDIVPKLNRVAFLAHGGDPAHKLFLDEALDIAPKLGIKIQPVVIEEPAKLPAAFFSMMQERAGAVVVQPLLTGRALGQGGKVAELAAKTPLADSVRQHQLSRSGRLDVLRRQPPRSVPARCDIHRQDFERNQAG